MRNRLLVGVVFILSIFVGFGLSSTAQPGPPRTYTCQWTQDTGPAAVETFEVVVDGAVSVTLPATACTGSPVLACSTPLTMTTNVPHVVVVRAVNLFGSAASVPFSAAPPGSPASVVIR